MKNAILYVSILLFLLISACKKDADAFTPEPAPKGPALFVAGYLPYWGMGNFDTSALPYLDRIYYFSVAPDVDGSFLMPDRDVQNLLSLGELARANTCELYLVVGGWYESETIHLMASTAEKRQAYITELVKVCKAYQLDGVDLDWENYPYPFDIDDFVSLVEELSSALQAANLGFTVALDKLHYNLATQIIDEVDAINLMLYGMLDENGNHSTMTHMVEGIAPFLSNDIPKEKLIVGVPFYGKRPYKEGDSSARAITYRYIVEKASPASSLNRYLNYSYNGPSLIKSKVQYLRSRRVYGIMSWELSQDVNYTSPYSLLQGMVNANK